MLRVIKKILNRQGGFGRDVTMLMSGTAIGQIIPIAMSPVLTRIFTPSDFALFGTFLSISNILIIVVTGRYDRAIMLPTKRKDALAIVALASAFTIGVCICLFVLFFFFGELISQRLDQPSLEYWLYWVPLLVLFGGFYQILNVFSNRQKKYKLLATSKVVKSGSTVLMNVGVSFLSRGPFGLIFGNITGQFFSFFVLLKNFLREERTDLYKVRLKNSLKQAKKYRKFPLLDMPSTLMNKSLNDVLVIEINRVFVEVVSGYYVLMRRILAMPISFFVTSFSDVFYQKLSENQDVEIMARQIEGFMKKLILYFVGPYFLFVYTSPLYVTFIFGENWSELYKLIYIFSPLFFLNIVLSPFGNVLRIINKQEVGLALNLMKSLFIVSVFYLFVVVNNNLLGFFALSLAQSLMGVVNAQIIYWKLIKKFNPYLVGLTLLVMLLFFINFHLIS